MVVLKRHKNGPAGARVDNVAIAGTQKLKPEQFRQKAELGKSKIVGILSRLAKQAIAVVHRPVHIEGSTGGDEQGTIYGTNMQQSSCLAGGLPGSATRMRLPNPLNHVCHLSYAIREERL
jgi:hypothetical protein